MVPSRDMADPAPRPSEGHTLHVRGLRVALPDGRILIDGVDLRIGAGEVVVLLGGSGAGKSTFARVLFEREELDAAGFEVVAAELDLDRGQLGLVPQRGALFDNLDVRGNLELALRHAEGDAQGTDADPAAWLARVGLDPKLAEPGTPVTGLSGGQAQRVAVARVLASRRKLLFLDEPSVGLDPHRVRVLARLIREQVKTLGISAIVVTHDVALAAGVADRMFLLSLEHRRLEQLFADRWPGALEDPGHDAATRGRWLVELEATLVDARLVYRGTVGPGDTALVTVSEFAGSSCQGDPIGGFNAAVQSSTEWTVLEGPFSVGPLGSFRVHADASGPSDAFVEIDEIRFVEATENRGTAGGYLYFDDFEGGGFCRWTFAVTWDLRGAE